MNFGLNADGDLNIVNNNWFLITGKDEIMQIVRANLEAVAGEWFLDLSLGLPWFDQILEKQNSGTNLDVIFIDALKTSEGVISVINFRSSLDRVARSLFIETSFATLDGILEFSGSIAPGGGN